MCCGRRRQQRAYRGPLVVVLGKIAYDKYQQRKAQKSIADAQVRELPSPEARSSMANDEILEKANINPPSYDEIVVNRAMVPETNVNFDEKAFDWTMAKGAVDEIANSFEDDRGHLTWLDVKAGAAQGVRVDVAAAVRVNVEADVAVAAIAVVVAAAEADAIKHLARADAKADVSRRRRSELQGGLRRRQRRWRCSSGSLEVLAVLYRSLVLLAFTFSKNVIL